ncbi:MAG TPA: DUF5054 domain-containing protein [Terriglobia bacterium]|nr:DUF5054 domain-containing protein [Terriglobia bacterium]
MRRREFVKRVIAAGGALTCNPGFGQEALAPSGATEVKRVMVMFKCHLDVGFTDTQAGVMRKYFDQYFPAAIQVAAAMRQSGEDRYIWTTGSWLPYEYLDQAAGETRKRAEQALEAGDLAWHALPFSWETEMLDRSLIEGAVGLSQSLDRRFGRRTVGAKMTDVPGHSRGLVAPLAAQGVKLLDIGVNGASTVPQVPPFFVWKDPEGASIVMMYHHGYGATLQVPGSDLVVSLQMRGDNSGPHSVEEVRKIYADLRKQFPGAKVSAASLSEIALAVEPYRGNLPVVTQEIGDTWIYGVPSDPVKVARYRMVVRLRKDWLEQGRLRVGDSADVALLRRLLLAAEHTWGVDTKRLKDYEHYTPKDLATVLDTPLFRWAESSWAEKRKDIDDAVANLPQALRAEASGRIRALQPADPDPKGLEPHPAGAEIETSHFMVALDPKTGAIKRLRAKTAKRDWASSERPLALFTYQTLSAEDYARYRAAYVIAKTWWAPMDFGKPNIEKFGAQSRAWLPTLVGCWSGKVAGGYRILTQLRIDDAEAEHTGLAAWPRKMYLDLAFPEAEPAVHLSFLCLGKPASRLPEAMWLSFLPVAPDSHGWTLDKVNQPVSPFDVVPGGNRHMHAVTSGVNYKDAHGGLSIETLDAPVAALGERSPIFYSTDQPEIAQGIHFSLYNNAWGTNYIQWFGEDTRFRFIVRA